MEVGERLERGRRQSSELRQSAIWRYILFENIQNFQLIPTFSKGKQLKAHSILVFLLMIPKFLKN